MNDHQSDTPLLSLRQFSAGFGGTTILEDVTMQIPPGGVFALLGPAGVGKSTLLRTLGRWNEQIPGFWTKGSALFHDRHLLDAWERDSAMRKVALLAQKARLFTASVEENAIDLVRPARAINRAAKRSLAESVLQPWGLWMELKPALHEPVTSLSIARQRMLSMARLLSGGAEALLVDEPLRDTDPAETESLIAFIQRVGEQRTVVMVTHNQQRTKQLAANVCLLVDGRIVESGTTRDFFTTPETSLGARYVRDGNCWPTRPEDFRFYANDNAEGDEPETDEYHSLGPPLPPAQTAEKEPRKTLRPGGFHWVIKGCLGGMQRPGLLREEDDDLHALQSLGAQYLVSLTEEPFPTERLARYGVVGIHFPILDMDVPDLESAAQLVASINRRIDAGMPTVLHCKAGLGRTGTLLACVLVYRGKSAVGAINEVRCANPRYIQSESQVAFIPKFAAYLDEHGDLKPRTREAG